MNQANVVDSSGWLEYLIDSDRAALFAEAIDDTANLLIPAIAIYEVFKKVLRERGESQALQVARVMQSGRVIDLDAALAMEASRYSLPLADSIIYAVAVMHDAILWTQDAHFDGLSQVQYFPK